MKLIADCGSTKIQWCAVENGNVVKEFFTPGLNAVMLTEEEITARLAAELKPEVEGMEFESIYFYGAGCINDDVCGNVRRAIAFGNAERSEYSYAQIRRYVALRCRSVSPR